MPLFPQDKARLSQISDVSREIRVVIQSKYIMCIFCRAVTKTIKKSILVTGN